MSRSRATEADHEDAFKGWVNYDPAFVEAELYLAKALRVELDEGEHFGEDWALTPDVQMLGRCRQVVDSEPRLEVLLALVYALRGSYHLKAAHEILTLIGQRTIEEWMDGGRSITLTHVIQHAGQAYRYGVRRDDIDFVLRMCDEPSLAAWCEGEDLRLYWFEALAKVKDPRVPAFARAIVRQDVDRWTDFRNLDALRILAKDGDPDDLDLTLRVARDHPDSYVRQGARRIVNRWR